MAANRHLRHLTRVPTGMLQLDAILPSQPFGPRRFPRKPKHLSILNWAILTAGTLALWWQATPRSAWAFPSNAEMRTVGSAPVGIAVQEFIDKPVSVLAREMLLQKHLDAQASSNQPVYRKIQVDLFAPGDFGVVVRYCW